MYAAKSGSRTLEDTVEAVIAELDRTGAWDREVLVLFTGTGTGWLQEWSLSAIEFLTAGNCATASLQYSYFPSPLTYLADRRSPRRAPGAALVQGVRRRMARSRPSGVRACTWPASRWAPSAAPPRSATCPSCCARSTGRCGRAPRASRRCGSG
ncbi:alpha/beta-hydrolase family protein [Brachybacterium sp. GPGPB12]|uniref:alpha/beta-hydrolase family protein n=1 Tax=Brachybacterium sp. GPGPB12 TaxID=3023517 RepID=UPI0031343AF7